MPARRSATELAQPHVAVVAATKTGVSGVTCVDHFFGGHVGRVPLVSSQLPPRIHSPFGVILRALAQCGGRTPAELRHP